MTRADGAPHTEWGSDARWIGRDPAEVAEFTFGAPQHDERPGISRSVEPPDILRLEFAVPGPVQAATALLSARGLYRCTLNGQRVGRTELTPGWTDYRHRIAFQTVDVTSLLHEGTNCWTATIADGWYAGYLGMDRTRQARHYGTVPGFRAQLNIMTTHEQVVVTDGAWRRSTGGITYADLMIGQGYDARLESTSWRQAGFDDSAWVLAAEQPEDDVELVPQRGPEVVVRQRLSPVQTVTSPTGSRIVDFGQNISGRVSLELPELPPGTIVHLRHGEALHPDGSLYTENLRCARAHDMVVSAGPALRFEPEFTVHGFRYVQLDGPPAALDGCSVIAEEIGTELATIGGFECSDPVLNRLHRNIEWTIRGNTVAVPTDCPQRDERLGWLGDAQLIMPTAAHLFDLGTFMDKWLIDIRDGQGPTGCYPDVAPRVVSVADGAPGWADAGVIVPWVVHRSHPDPRRLSEHWASMVAFMHDILDRNPSLIRRAGTNHNFGDWLNLGEETPKDLLATAYWAHCADLMARMAPVVDQPAEPWSDLRGAIGRAFAEAFVDPDGRLAGHSQSGYALALGLGLVPDARRAAATARLAGLIQDAGALRTGIHGTKFLLAALTDNGRLDLAYRLLQRDESPGWRYAVAQGATTVWERWDGYSADDGFQTAAMNSLNHYALGSVGEWLHRYAAGLRPRGGCGVRLRPHPGGGLTAARTWTRVADSPTELSWQLRGDTFAMTAALPDENRWTPVDVPTSEPASVRVDVGDGQLRDRESVAPGFVSYAVRGSAVSAHSVVAPDWRPGPLRWSQSSDDHLC